MAGIIDFQRLFAALDEVSACLPHADRTDDADIIGIGLRLQAVRLEAMRLHHIHQSGQIKRRTAKRARG